MYSPQSITYTVEARRHGASRASPLPLRRLRLPGECQEATERASAPLSAFLKAMKPRVDKAITTSKVEQRIRVNSLIPIWDHMLHGAWKVM